MFALRVVPYNSTADEPVFALSPTAVETLHVLQVSANGRTDLFSSQTGRLDPRFVLSARSIQHTVTHRQYLESRTYNIDVYDATGSELCSMIGLQLKEVSRASPPEVKTRYDIVLQPVFIEGPMPRLPVADFTGREVQDEVYNYLDRVAQEVIRDSLAKEPVVGEEVLHDYNLSRDKVPNHCARPTA